MRSHLIPVTADVVRGRLRYLPDFLAATYVNVEKSLEYQQQLALPARYVGYPDLLSAKLYGTTDYWWVLCMVNGIIDPFLDMEAGVLWRIPTHDSLQKAVDSSLASGSSAIGTVVTI